MEDKVINPLTDDLDWPEYDSAKLAEDVDDEEYDPMSFDYKPVTVSEAEQKAAEKAFTDELTNGPEVPVRYGNGAVYRKKIGSFDLENMHKAYDQWFIDNKLLDIFRADGKFKNKGTYVRYKSMNPKEPAVKALKAMYTAQFSTEMPFTSDKRAEEAKKKAEAEEQAKLEEKRKLMDTVAEEVCIAIRESLLLSSEWNDLVEQYPESMRSDLDVSVTQDTYISSMRKDIYTRFTVRLIGVLAMHSMTNFITTRDFIIDPVGKAQQEEVVEMALVLIQSALKAAAALLFVVRNFEMFQKKHPEHELMKKGITLGYYNTKNGKVARTKLIELSCSFVDSNGNVRAETRNGLLLVNAEDEKDKANILGSSWNLIMCSRHIDSSSGRCWNSETWEEYFNRPGNPLILNRLRVHTTEREGSNGGTEVRRLPSVDSPYSKYFNSGTRCTWELDSSD